MPRPTATPGSDTLGNIARLRGLYAAQPGAPRDSATSSRWPASPPSAEPAGCYGRCALASPGKDTTTGHWEMVGIHLAKPFPLYPHGFPPEIMDEFERRIGRRSLGNKAASGTEIIRELGEEHMRTGSPIVYTSADSVFQVAAHEEVIPLWELYKICETAREILRGPYEVGRVIARPFIGAPGSVHPHPQSPGLRRAAAPRHAARRARRPRGRSTQRGQDFRRIPGPRHPRLFERPRATPTAWRTRSKPCETFDAGLIFVNLVDFDQQYGHRNDVEGYAARARSSSTPGCRSSFAAERPATSPS